MMQYVATNVVLGIVGIAGFITFLHYFFKYLDGDFDRIGVIQVDGRVGVIQINGKFHHLVTDYALTSDGYGDNWLFKKDYPLRYLRTHRKANKAFIKHLIEYGIWKDTGSCYKSWKVLFDAEKLSKTK